MKRVEKWTIVDDIPQWGKTDGLFVNVPSQATALLPKADLLKLIYELESHQVELETLNDQGRQALSATRQAVSFYNNAPVGFFTLAREGGILDLNRHGEHMLGKGRSLFKNSRFVLYVTNDTKPVFNLFLRDTFVSKARETCNVGLITSGDHIMPVILTGIVTPDGRQCLLTVVAI